ncbi:hypothetical protein TNCV_83481 [Trichonephila clavipes]|nr:hypothetical protein TNCV_83481 [Trichonephila clavipes]
MSSSPVPLKTRRVGKRCTLNLSRVQTSSRWCGVVVRRVEVPSQVSSSSLDHGSKLRGHKLVDDNFHEFLASIARVYPPTEHDEMQAYDSLRLSSTAGQSRISNNNKQHKCSTFLKVSSGKAAYRRLFEVKRYHPYDLFLAHYQEISHQNSVQVLCTNVDKNRSIHIVTTVLTFAQYPDGPEEEF